MPRSFELFAGGGGMALGLHAAGFEHGQLVEWEPKACQTLRLNADKPDAPWHGEAVVEADVRQYVRSLSNVGPDLDLVAGGPPCQPFSLGGVHAGHADNRNMFPAALEVVRATRPKLVIFENVPGLLRPSFVPYFEYVQKQLSRAALAPRPDELWTDHRDRIDREKYTSDLRYRVRRQVINSADLGVPQTRSRVFLIGIREDLDAAWHDLEADHSLDALLYDQWVDGSYWEEHADSPEVQQFCSHGGHLQPPLRQLARVGRLRVAGRPARRRWRTVRDALKAPDRLPHPVDGEQLGHWPNHVGVPGARSYPGHTGSDIDLPAKTIKAGVHGVCGGEAMIRYRDDSLRYMTVRESARIQGFPDWYEFTGARSHAMRQIGNAVAVRVAEAVGVELRKLIGI